MSPLLDIALKAFTDAGIQSKIDKERLMVTLGAPSGGLACIQLPADGYVLPAAAVAILSRAPRISSSSGVQLFFRFDPLSPFLASFAKFPYSRHMPQCLIDGDTVTYPTEGYKRESTNSFTKLPILTTENQGQLVRALTQTHIIDPPATSAAPDAPDLMFQTMRVTQDNVALIFADKYKNDFRFCKAWGTWHKYDGTRWVTEGTDLAFDYCRLIARKVSQGGNSSASSAGFAGGVERFARASRVFATEPRQWDSDNWLLNLPDSTIDLRSGKSRPHALGDYLTMRTAVSPSAGPKPIFDRFMRDITLEDGALADYLQRSLGACLSGAIQDCFMSVWIGTGRNGKNTLGDLIDWIFGNYSKVIPSETLMAQRNGPQHPTDLANLRGLRLAISSEVEEGSYFNESRIKSLTGDAQISARFMRQDYFEFPRTHKHLVFGNHRPMLRMVDPAIRKRLHLVPFKADFSDDKVCDPLMPQRLLAEAPQVLQWLIDGHALWLEDGYLKKCSAVEAETAAYFDAQSTPEMWLDERCQVDTGLRATAKELYASYKEWKEARGEGVMSQTRLAEFLHSRGLIKSKSHGNIIYLGVSLQPQSILDASPR